MRVYADSGMGPMQVESATEPLLRAEMVPRVNASGVPSCCGWAVEGRICVSTFSFPPVTTRSPRPVVTPLSLGGITF